MKEMSDPMYELGQFLGGYLHQDWDLDAKSPSEAVNKYISQAQRINIEESLSQLRKLLAENKQENELADILLHELGCYYYPPGDGYTFSGWLKNLAQQLEEGLKTKKS